MIVLDTDVLIEIFDKESKKGNKSLKKVIESGESICITAINLHEILYGLNKYAKLVKDVLMLPVLSYKKEDAVLSSELELKMERKGLPIRRIDTMIAAITINNKGKLYTFDVRHFKPLKEFGLNLFNHEAGNETKNNIL